MGRMILEDHWLTDPQLNSLLIVANYRDYFKPDFLAQRLYQSENISQLLLSYNIKQHNTHSQHFRKLSVFVIQTLALCC